jgi:hypothetical protein
MIIASVTLVSVALKRTPKTAPTRVARITRPQKDETRRTSAPIAVLRMTTGTRGRSLFLALHALVAGRLRISDTQQWSGSQIRRQIKLLQGHIQEHRVELNFDSPGSPRTGLPACFRRALSREYEGVNKAFCLRSCTEKAVSGPAGAGRERFAPVDLCSRSTLRGPDHVITVWWKAGTDRLSEVVQKKAGLVDLRACWLGAES